MFLPTVLYLCLFYFWGAFFETPKKQTSIQNQEKISEKKLLKHKSKDPEKSLSR